MRNGLEHRRAPRRGKAELPLASGPGELMTPLAAGKLLVDGCDRAGRGLEASMKRLSFVAGYVLIRLNVK